MRQPKPQPPPMVLPKLSFKEEQQIWKKHKICPKHGKTCLLLKEANHPGQTGFCAHPDCVRGQLYTLAWRMPVLKFYLKLYPDAETLMGMCLEALLGGAAWGRVTVIHGGNFLRFLTLGALAKERANEEKVKQHKELRVAIDELIEDTGREQLATGITPGSALCGFQNSGRNPEDALIGAELLALFARDFGWDGLLYILESITIRELAKVRQQKVTEVQKVFAQEELKKWYIKRFA